jgi:hypothetical protein
MSHTMFLIHCYHPFRYMDPPCEKYSKNQDDPGVGPSQPRKARKKSIIIKRPTPPDDIEEEELDLPLKMHQPLERGTRNHMNYPKMDLATITTSREEDCYASWKITYDLRFWTLLLVDWYRSV